MKIHAGEIKMPDATGKRYVADVLRLLGGSVAADVHKRMAELYSEEIAEPASTLRAFWFGWMASQISKATEAPLSTAEARRHASASIRLMISLSRISYASSGHLYDVWSAPSDSIGERAERTAIAHAALTKMHGLGLSSATLELAAKQFAWIARSSQGTARLREVSASVCVCSDPFSVLSRLPSLREASLPAHNGLSKASISRLMRGGVPPQAER